MNKIAFRIREFHFDDKIIVFNLIFHMHLHCCAATKQQLPILHKSAAHLADDIAFVMHTICAEIFSFSEIHEKHTKRISWKLSRFQAIATTDPSWQQLRQASINYNEFDKILFPDSKTECINHSRRVYCSEIVDSLLIGCSAWTSEFCWFSKFHTPSTCLPKTNGRFASRGLVHRVYGDSASPKSPIGESICSPKTSGNPSYVAWRCCHTNLLLSIKCLLNFLSSLSLPFVFVLCFFNCKSKQTIVVKYLHWRGRFREWWPGVKFD